jgi:hypothetical protein
MVRRGIKPSSSSAFLLHYTHLARDFPKIPGIPHMALSLRLSFVLNNQKTYIDTCMSFARFSSLKSDGDVCLVRQRSRYKLYKIRQDV